MKNFRFMLAMLALCVFALPTLAQTSAGSLVGTVTDQNNSVVAGATVELIDTATNKTRTVIASDEGTFTISQLDVGQYILKVTATGFKTYNATDLKIDTGRQYSLNITLEPGGVQESITVVAGADVINATNAELSNTVSPRQIKELPLNGRNPLALILLQAGTSSNGATNTSINGQRTSFTNITRDGINIQDNFIRANATDFAPQRPGVDDISEFTLTTSNADASAGYGASQVQVSTERGQSDFHGAIFEYSRKSRFSSRPFFAAQRAFLNRNQYGGKIGGPVPLPRFGEGGMSTYKNKGFFFFNYEAFRQEQTTDTLKTILVPQARTGVFTYVDSAGATRSINLITAFGSRFGITGVNPVVQSRILDLVPGAGNSTDAGDGRNTTGFRLNVDNNVRRNNWTGRFDVEANAKNTFNFIYAYGDEINDRPDVASGYTPAPLVVQPATRNFLSTGWSWTPSASFSNELRGGFFSSEPIFNPTNPRTDFTLTIPLISNPETTFQEQGRKSENYTISDNATYSMGDHALRFGGTGTTFRTNSFASFDVVPRYSLQLNNSTGVLAATDFTGGISTAQLAAANSLLGLLGGIAGRVDQTFNATKGVGYVPFATNRQLLDFENYGFYFTDQWRVSPRLTLNLGVRYEIYTALRERNGNALEPVIGNNDVNATILNPIGTVDFIGTNGGGNQFFKTDKNNFAPIVSFAWSPMFKNSVLGALFGSEGRTVLRGGYRASFANDEFVRGPDNAQGGNSGLSTARAFLVGPAAGNRLGSPLFQVPAPAFVVPRTFADGDVLSGLNFGTVFAVDPNLKTPMTHEWNFGIQREIGFQTALEIRYVGGKSDNLVRGLDLNEVIINANGFTADFNRARANLITFGAAACSAAQAIATGCQQLQIFPGLPGAGLLTNATVIANLRGGTPAGLADFYITSVTPSNAVGTSGLRFDQFFQPNFNAGAVDVLTNAGKYRYHSLQAEIRRRFSQGFHLQANYTFQKTLTDASGVGQTKFEPNFSNLFPESEYSRADYDSTHVFNLNTIYELPFGSGKRWLNGGGGMDRLFGGWQVSSIVQISTGAPITIVDPRSNLTRRNARQTALTNLNKDQIKNLVGIFRTPCGVFYINPSVIDIDQGALSSGNCANLLAGGRTGRGARGFGEPTFPGQVFFNNNPGQTSGLERAFLNGPLYFNWDASVIKNIRITEGTRIQLRAEAFNVLNRANFFASQFGNLNINSTNFGRVTSTFTSSGAQRVMQFAARFEF